MRPTILKRLAAGALFAACALHNSTVVGQTPEQEKMWEAQRAQTQAEEKIQAEKLAKERQARAEQGDHDARRRPPPPPAAAHCIVGETFAKHLAPVPQAGRV